MIRLTSYHNRSPIYVPAEVVVKENYKYDLGSENGLPTTEYRPIDGAMVVYGGNEYGVKESPEEVARKVMLYYRYKEVHHTACRELESEEERETFHKLLELAGLEEPNHD